MQYKYQHSNHLSPFVALKIARTHSPLLTLPKSPSSSCILYGCARMALILVHFPTDPPKREVLEVNLVSLGPFLLPGLPVVRYERFRYQLRFLDLAGTIWV